MSAYVMNVSKEMFKDLFQIIHRQCTSYKNHNILFPTFMLQSVGIYRHLLK